MRLICASKSRTTAARLSLSDGVRCPDSTVKSASSTTKLRIDSALETSRLASSTAPWRAARTDSSASGFGGAHHRHLARRAPVCQAFRVQVDQGGDERPAVPDHHGLADQLVLADLLLQRSGGDVLAAGGDQQVLLPAGDGQEAVLVKGAEVAGAEEAVHERLARWPPRWRGSP